MSDLPLPDVFLPYQQELWRAIDAYPVVVVEKSRRTGFTWAVAAPAVEYASKAGPTGMDVVYVGYDEKMTREFIGYIQEFGAAFQAACSDTQDTVWVDPLHPERSVGTYRVTFASGHEVNTLPSVARALRGKQALAILDEAAFMGDLAGMIKAALAYLIWGGKVVIISTHDGDTNPFNELVVAIRAGKHPDFKLLRLTFEEAVAQGLYERVCLRTGVTPTPDGKVVWRDTIERIYADNADEELGVIPNPSTGAYLTTVQLEACATATDVVVRWNAPAGFDQLREPQRKADVERWIAAELAPRLHALQPSEAHAFGEDFGRIHDLTVMWLLAIGRDLVRRTRLVVELRRMPYKQQEQVMIAICDRAPRLRALKLDAGGNGGYLAEAAAIEYGEGRVEQLKLSEDWYRAHMPRMKSGIEDRSFILPRDDEVLGDFRMLKLVRGVGRVPDRRRDAKGENRHGDAAIAGCLAYAASEAEAEEYGYEPAPPVREDAGQQRGWSIRARDEEEDARRPARDIFPTFRMGAF